MLLIQKNSTPEWKYLICCLSNAYSAFHSRNSVLPPPPTHTICHLLLWWNEGGIWRAIFCIYRDGSFSNDGGGGGRRLAKANGWCKLISLTCFTQCKLITLEHFCLTYLTTYSMYCAFDGFRLACNNASWSILVQWANPHCHQCSTMGWQEYTYNWQPLLQLHDTKLDGGGMTKTYSLLSQWHL